MPLIPEKSRLSIRIAWFTVSNPSLKSRKIPHDQSHDHLQYIDQFAVEFYQYTVNGKVSWMFAAQKPNWPWKSELSFFRNYFKIFEN